MNCQPLNLFLLDLASFCGYSQPKFIISGISGLQFPGRGGRRGAVGGRQPSGRRSPAGGGRAGGTGMRRAAAAAVGGSTENQVFLNNQTPELP